LGFCVERLGFRVWQPYLHEFSRLRVQGLGRGVYGVGSGVWGLGFGVVCLGFSS